ncbi:MAG TPA: hypothetical protein VF527_07330 [Pyrinomonadaceae bacterium]|jgi:hypothetical protein
MPRIADYAVITDGKFAIQTGGDIDKDFDFTLESGVHLGSRSILAFVLFATSAANSLKFEVKINGTAQLSYTVTGFRTNTLHEVIDANVLKAGSNNIAFRITGGSGALEFGDTVLLYQRDI